MNIWEWTYGVQRELRSQGSRLADLMDDIPHFTCENEHERAEALFPEALAAARQMRLPWVELFVRHWRLQSRVLRRHEVAGNLTEAIDLLDFAHREDTRDCPQSVCCVQDLASCYAKIDGPGYAEERIEVSREGLERITPAWDCYSCINVELVSGLIDCGRADEALKTARDALGRMHSPDANLQLEAVQALLALDRPDEALRAVEATPATSGGGEDYAERRGLAIALCRARLADFAGAERALPTLAAVLRTASHYANWCEVAGLLVDGAHWANDSALDATLSEMAARLESNGSLRLAFELRSRQADLALERGRPFTATLASRRMRSLAAAMAKPLDAPARIAALEARLATARDDEVAGFTDADDPGAVAERLAGALEDGDREQSLHQLYAAHERWPAEPALLEPLYQALHAGGWTAESIELTDAARKRTPNDATPLLMWGFALIEARREAELLEAATSAIARHAPLAAEWHWLCANAHRRTGETEACLDDLDALLELRPDAWNTRRMHSEILLELERLDEALADLDHLASLASGDDEPDRNLQWDRLTLASRLGRWRASREIAAAMGFELDDAPLDHPVDERWESCWIRISPPGERDRLVLAQRAGPVTARLVQIPPPGGERRLDDLVVFDPAPLNPPPPEDADEDTRHNHRFEYAFLCLVTAGAWTAYELDGRHPGDERLERLGERLEALGCILSRRSGEDYRLLLDDGEDVEALYAFIAVGESTDVAEVAAVMRATLADAPEPLAWTSLARAGGDHELAERHAAVSARFGLDT